MPILDFTIPFNPIICTNHQFHNLTGQVFGQLTVISIYGRVTNEHAVLWLCQCSCNTWITIRSASLLRRRFTSSCGCSVKERLKRQQYVHGESHNTRTLEYRSYTHARNRCNNPRNKSFHNYGGRGIEFRFMSYREFLDHIGRRPTSRHTLNRIDNNGHYEIGNVEWATPEKQGRNKRNNVNITFQGHIKNLAEWCILLNLDYHAVYQRMYRGLSGSQAIERSLT